MKLKEILPLIDDNIQLRIGDEKLYFPICDTKGIEKYQEYEVTSMHSDNFYDDEYVITYLRINLK